MLLRHEGLRLKPYRDTVGVLTIGVGHNLDEGISEEVALFMLRLDIAEAMAELHAAYPWFAKLDNVRQEVLVDMAFNLGAPRLANFRKTLAALAAGDWQTAHDEMLASKWAEQVGHRAVELARMILSGAY
jgi:lysozyme